MPAKKNQSKKPASTKGDIQQLLPKVERYLKALHPTDPFEIRTVKPARSGVFDDHSIAAKQCLELTRRSDVYVSVNPTGLPVTNKMQGNASKDADITKRTSILIDVDPVRGSGTAATDDQRNAAKSLADRIKTDLTALDFADPIYGCTGNGYALIYRVDLPNDADAKKLVNDFLGALDRRYSTDAAKVDTTVGNAGRIGRVFFTYNHKGKKRQPAKCIVPKSFDELSAQTIRDYVGTGNPAVEDSKTETRNGSANAQTDEYGIPVYIGPDFDLSKWVDDSGLSVIKAEPTDDFQERWHFKKSPFCKHKGKDVFLARRINNGGIVFKCSHNSCAGEFGWDDLRDFVEGNSEPISNAVIELDEKERATVIRGKTVKEIAADITRVHNGWPKSVANVLVVPDEVDDDGTVLSVRVLQGSNGLIGWLGSERGIRLQTHPLCLTASQIAGELVYQVERYDSIRTAPTFPDPLERVLYLGRTIEPKFTGALDDFLGHFCFESDDDQQACKAMVISLMAKIPPGGRPGWLIDTLTGVGSGKTALVNHVVDLTGGKVVDIQLPTRNADELTKRLLDPDNIGATVARVDNLKTTTLSHQGIEKLMTSNIIQGNAKYKNETTVDNHLTWVITVNDGSLCADLASRFNRIRVRKLENRSPNWSTDLTEWIRVSRQRVWQDIAAILSKHPAPIDETITGRWGPFVSAVVSKLDDPERLLRFFETASDEMDHDKEVAESIGERLLEFARKKYETTQNLFLPTDEFLIPLVGELLDGNNRAGLSAKFGKLHARRGGDFGEGAKLRKDRLQLNGQRLSGYYLNPSDGAVPVVAELYVPGSHPVAEG